LLSFAYAREIEFRQPWALGQVDQQINLIAFNAININGIIIADSESDVINFAELKTLPNLRIKKYNDAIFFG